MKIFSLILFILIAAANASAQEITKRVEVEGIKRDEPAALPEYVVEVRRDNGCIVAPVHPKYKTGCVLYALPRPRVIQPDSSGHPITSKVFVYAKQQGEQWDVKVSIGTGEFYDAGDTKVGEFKLNLNERVTVNEVSRFGLNPIRVGVAKIIRQDSDRPTFRNLTQSLSVESIEANALPDPFKVQLKNNSGSDLVAIQYHTFRQQQFLEMKWLSPGLLNPLIKASETYRLAVSSEDKSCGDAEGYQPNQSDRIEFVSAVFADGTYEGQSGLAALIKGTALGNRRNLERVIDTIRSFTDGDPADLATQLSYLQQGLNEETDPSMVETLRMWLPPVSTDANALNGFIRSGMHEVKVNLARDVRYFEFLKSRNNPQVTKEWLKRIKTKYERWLTAAENMTSK